MAGITLLGSMLAEVVDGGVARTEVGARMDGEMVDGAGSTASTSLIRCLGATKSE